MPTEVASAWAQRQLDLIRRELRSLPALVDQKAYLKKTMLGRHPAKCLGNLGFRAAGVSKAETTELFAQVQAWYGRAQKGTM